MFWRVAVFASPRGVRRILFAQQTRSSWRQPSWRRKSWPAGLTFVTLDRQQADAAEREGFPVLGPD
jgi:hypothetical protein